MKTILIVEDDEIIREDVSEILNLAGYTTAVAINGKDGWEKTLELKPDLIISDIAMPGIDGLSMLHLLRKNQETINIPLIFLTSKSEKSDLRSAMDAGADDYIIKPFSGDELLRAVENRFERLNVISRKLVPRPELFIDVDESGPANIEKSITIHKANHDIAAFQKKQTIYKEGHSPFNLYYVQKGKVRTFKVHEDGKPLVVGLYGEGDYLGYIALLEDTPYRETAEALDETELVMVPRKEFENLINTNINVLKKFLKILANNVSESERLLVGLAYDTLRVKAAKALCYVTSKFNLNKTENYLIDLSRDDLAAIAGTATESLIRCLTEFKNEKLIDIRKDNKIEVLNFKKLCSLAR